MSIKNYGLYTALLVVTMLLAFTGYASADGPVGADCTDPPNPGAVTTSAPITIRVK